MSSLNILNPFYLGAATLYILQDATKEKHKQPRFNVLATRTQEGLSQETNAIIDLITVDPHTFPVGSFRYRAHRYPGDIDIFEKVKACCTKNVAKKQIAANLQEIALRIKNARDEGVFLGDFKAGIDDRYKIDIGSTDNYNNLSGYEPEKIRSDIKGLYNNKLLTNAEYRNLLSLVVDRPGLEDWEELHNVLRKYYTIRWNLDELIRGEKRLRGDKNITLADAITHDSIVKLDIWAPIHGKYNEITNFFLIILQHPDNTETVLNAKLGDRLEQLDKDIRKYASPEHRNSLKLAKRLWNKALTSNNEELYNKLYPLFNSDAAMLSQINSEIEVISSMLEELPRNDVPIEILIKQIDGFKERLSNTFEIQMNTRTTNRIINQILEHYEENPRTWNPRRIISSLRKLHRILKKSIEDYSKKYLEEKGIDL